MSSHREQWHSFGGISIDLRLWDIIFGVPKLETNFKKHRNSWPFSAHVDLSKSWLPGSQWFSVNPKKSNKHLHPPHSAFHHAAPGSFKFLQRSLSGVFSQTTDDSPPPQGCDAWQPWHPERGLQIGATLLKMVMVSSFLQVLFPISSRYKFMCTRVIHYV